MKTNFDYLLEKKEYKSFALQAVEAEKSISISLVRNFLSLLVGQTCAGQPRPEEENGAWSPSPNSYCLFPFAIHAPYSPGLVRGPQQPGSKRVFLLTLS